MIKGSVSIKRTGTVVQAVAAEWTKTSLADFIKTGIMSENDLIEITVHKLHPWDSSKDRQYVRVVPAHVALSRGLV